MHQNHVVSERVQAQLVADAVGSGRHAAEVQDAGIGQTRQQRRILGDRQIEERIACRMRRSRMVLAEVPVHAGEGITHVAQTLGQVLLHVPQRLCDRLRAALTAGHWQHVDVVTHHAFFARRVARVGRGA